MAMGLECRNLPSYSDVDIERGEARELEMHTDWEFGQHRQLVSTKKGSKGNQTLGPRK